MRKTSNSPSLSVQRDAKDSFLTEPVVKMLVGAAASTEFTEMTEQMLGTIMSTLWIGQSNIGEGGFQRLRCSDEQTKRHKVTVAGRYWAAPHSREVLGKVFGYQEVKPSDCTDKTAAGLSKTRLDKNTFQPQGLDCHGLPLKAIMGIGAATWATFMQQTQAKQNVAMGLWRFCCAAPAMWAMYDRVWLSQMLQPGMLVRNTQRSSLAQWTFVLGSVEGKVAQGWPATQGVDGGRAFFSPHVQGVRDLWLPVVTLDGWEVQPLDWTPVLASILVAPSFAPAADVLRRGVVG